MAVLVVEALEPIDVDHHQGQRGAVPCAARLLDAQLLLQLAHVAEAGRVVDVGVAEQLLPRFELTQRQRHARDQLGARKRLCQKVRGGQLEPAKSIGEIGRPREKDHGDLGSQRIFAQLLGDSEAIGFRHHHVENDFRQIGRPGPRAAPGTPRRCWLRPF